MDNIGYWYSASDFATWQFDAIRPGTFSVIIDQSCARGCGGKYAVILGSERIEATVLVTGKWENYTRLKLGSFAVPRSGRFELKVQPIEIIGEALMNIRMFVLRPTAA